MVTSSTCVYVQPGKSLPVNHVLLSLKDTAGACVFLACKTEETGRKLRDVAVICHAKASGQPPTTDEQDPVWLLPLFGLFGLSYEGAIERRQVDETHHTVRRTTPRGVML